MAVLSAATSSIGASAGPRPCSPWPGRSLWTRRCGGPAPPAIAESCRGVARPGSECESTSRGVSKSRSLSPLKKASWLSRIHLMSSTGLVLGRFEASYKTPSLPCHGPACPRPHPGSRAAAIEQALGWRAGCGFVDACTACELLAATLSRPACERGWRAERRKPMASRSARGRLAARLARSVRPRFCTLRLAWSSPGLSRLMRRRVVSQLLAGTPSGPGRSPAPPECLVATKPAGAAPRPASRRLVMRPLVDEVSAG